MAEARMAGDALKDQHFAARERKSNDPEQAAERASRVGDSFDVSGYSDKEISMALQGDTFDKNDYARLTGETIGDTEPKKEQEPDFEIKPLPGDGSSPVTEERSKPERTPIQLPGMRDGAQTQVVNQDNDIYSTVTGDNNTVTNTQDNSVRQFGAYGTASRAKSLRDKYVADVSRFTRG